jgi:hypothetical protein
MVCPFFGVEQMCEPSERERKTISECSIEPVTNIVAFPYEIDRINNISHEIMHHLKTNVSY